ncbi:MAG: TetR/AcrR family transcriptional regulator [Lachnospiraceae bacterium]|nr:TetR/AcrR family transcriptional regulator [Lachnospiraceae bacterium]
MRKQSKRVARTRKEIEEAYLLILEERPQSKITVKEVCERAKVNRTTFYKYYEDADYLGSTIRSNMLEFVENLLKETIPADHSDCYEFLSQVILTMNRDVCFRKLPILLKEEDFSSRFKQLLDNYYYRPKYGNLMTDEDWVRITYLSAGACGLVSKWLETGMKIPPEKLANNVIDFSKRIFGAK